MYVHVRLSICAQRIHYTVDEREQRRLLMDLDVVKKSTECPYIVQFYGCLFAEVRLGVITAGLLFSLALWLTC